MKNTIFFLIALMLTMACNDSEVNQSDDNFEEIYQQFHGKYEIVSSISDRPVDLDRDGKASVDLLQEIPNIEHSHLVIAIKENGINGENMYLFSHGWPEQHLSQDLPNYVQYAQKVVSSRFTLNDRRDVLFIEEDASDEFPLPEEVTVNDKGQIQTVISRELFTPDGWQTVTITSTYARYTMAT